MKKNFGRLRLYAGDLVEELAPKVDYSVPYKEYSNWLESLPLEPIEGLADMCWLWIKSWGSGGGNREAETRIKIAIIEYKTDQPQELADVIYKSVAGCCLYPFEASVLTMDVLNECISGQMNGQGS